MELGPILSSLRRNRSGAALIALQIALTLAVLCNALFIIRQQTGLSRRPSGVGDEGSVFVITNRWVGQSSDLAAREQADLAALRSLPQIVDAIVSNTHPLGGPGLYQAISLHPGNAEGAVAAMVYFGDEHAMNTLGLRLAAGRNFNADEIVNRNSLADAATRLDGVIVTKAVARALSPDGNILGRIAIRSSV
jgi:putative ABC transport system permease protein